MSETQNRKQRRWSPWILGVVVFVLLLFLVLLQSSNLWKTFTVDTASDTLLLYALSSLNFIAFVIFGFIFLRSIIKLIRERRAFLLGSRIKTRLLLYFVAISLLPIMAMAGFSYLFMNRAIERWFTQIPENVVRAPIKVQEQATAEQHLKLFETAKMLAAVIEERDVTADELKKIADDGNLTLIELLSKEGTVIGSHSKILSPELEIELKKTLDRLHARDVSQTGADVGLNYGAAVAPLSDGRRLVLIPAINQQQNVELIVTGSLHELDKLKGQQVVVQQVGFLTLGVLTFLLIFAASWTAFYIARGLTVPIRALAEGADEIAQGNFAHRVDVFAEDELALLVSTFNQMSGKLEENSAEIGERRRYIETILQSLPTGVISFDREDRINTINRSALNILRLENADFKAFKLEQLVSRENSVVLERLLARAKRIGRASEQTSLMREDTDGNRETGNDLTVALTATALPDENGVVLVIEDLSDLISAQRAFAWQEVAQRMAHEIKNPLTPIQLSAERIEKRFRNNGNADIIHLTGDNTVDVIRSGTQTILREVASLKSMVDEFSRFARLPSAHLEAGDLNAIITEVLTLYNGRPEAKFESRLADGIPAAMIDGEQIKRVFVNLIENAIESFGSGQIEREVVVSSRYDAARDIIVAEVSDNGSGVAAGDIQKLFQPYFSTKGRGTGLGLAIVNRIVSEHQGRIHAAANSPRGTKFIVELPVFTG